MPSHTQGCGGGVSRRELGAIKEREGREEKVKIKRKSIAKKKDKGSMVILPIKRNCFAKCFPKQLQFHH